MKQPVKNRLRSIADTAIELGLSPASVYRLNAQGSLPFVKIGMRTLVDVNDIERLIAQKKA